MKTHTAVSVPMLRLVLVSLSLLSTFTVTVIALPAPSSHQASIDPPASAPALAGLNRRDESPDANNLNDNIFAAAATAYSQDHGWGGGKEADKRCDLSAVVLPSDLNATTPLPTPTGKLSYVAIGRGVQFYTCASTPSSPTATPATLGAAASLFDATCMAATSPALLFLFPLIALQFPQPSSSTDELVGMKLLGRHYFTSNATVPTFDLKTGNGDAGFVYTKANVKVPAPSGAPAGRNGKGHGSVDWLALGQKPGVQAPSGEQTFKQVYRINTAGGKPPGSCEGVSGNIEVQYAAEYWFYE